jgi:hypothetical protein
VRISGAGLLLLAVLCALTGCAFHVTGAPLPEPSRDSVGQGDVPAGTLAPAAASTALAALPVTQKTSLIGYERGCGEGEGCVFGPAWSDIDRNGCDQRNDVLRRDLTGIEVREGTHECVVIAGLLHDPYSGATVRFDKASAAEIPIDHVVPLAAAWVQGAARWTTAERTAFANDPANLMATTRAENSAKGDSTAEEWVPDDPTYGCSYATIVVTVKQRFSLSVTAEEERALESLLGTC